MKHVRLLVGLSLTLGVIVAVGVTLTGSGTIGTVSTWSVQESCTPAAIGDTSGSVGSASLDAAATSDSVFAVDNGFALTDTNLGTFNGNVVGSPVTGSRVQLDAKGGLGFLVAERTVEPVWAVNGNDLTFLEYGAGTGQVGNVYAIAVDTFDDSIFVMSYGTVNGVDRHRVIKFSSAGAYITEFGSSGSADGQFGGAAGLAVDPSSGAVYVGDGVNRRVQKFTTSGGRTTYTFAAKVGAAGTGDGQFGSGVIGLVVSAAGDVFATDRGNKRLQKFNSSLTFQAKVSTAGTAGLAPYSVQTDGTYIYASILTATGSRADGVIEKYNTSLTLQSTLTITSPVATETGIGNFAFESDGTFWAQWFLAPYLVRYSSAGVELGRWYSEYPAAVDLNTNYNLAVNSDDDVHVLFRPTGANPSIGNPYGGKYVTTFDYAPITLSAAIESYMEACDPTLGGYTYSYTASSDPNVVIPGWSGNVWAQLKELCATYKLEIVLVNGVITVRDLGSQTMSIDNKTVPTITPSNVSGGRQVNIVVQNPSAGGGLMYDAADTNTIYSVDVGQRLTFTVRAPNFPVSLASMVPTDTLPVQPGQYYVVDANSTAVPAATWFAAGGSITAKVGDGVGEIVFTLTGPTAQISGYTGPFTFATSRSGTPTFSITGNGVTVTPTTIELLTGADESKTTRQVAYTVDTPFIDTTARAYDRGVWASQEAAGPNVTVTFAVSTESLSGFGLTPGAVFSYADSKWRVTDVTYGVVQSTITATRHVTLGEIDTIWSGQTLGTYDTFWSGYSLGDQTIRPLDN